MAKILSDRDLQKLLGESIIGADSSCLRPNSYILRLGSKGEFINTEKKLKSVNWEEKEALNSSRDMPLE